MFLLILYRMLVLTPNILIANSNPTDNDERLLHIKLLSNYNKYIRPVIDLATPVDIYATIMLHTFNDLDLVNNLLTAQYYIGLQWTDENLQWDPSDYNNITNIHLGKENVWKPPIVLCNSMGNSEETDDFLEIWIFSNGHVVMYSFKLLNTYCQVNAYTYPFDKHMCEIYMCVALHSTQHTRIKSLHYYDLNWLENYEWDITLHGTVNASNDEFSYAFAPMYLRRKLTIEVIAMLIPSVIMTVLTIFVFLLPPESGKKVFLAMTTFLSNVLYLVQMEKTTPKNSKYPCLLMLYLMLLSMMSGFTAIGSVIISKLYVIQTSDEVKSNSPNENRKRPHANQIADVSIIASAQSNTLNPEERPRKKWLGISDYNRWDDIFLRISIVISVIVSLIFTCLLFTQQD
ncbi:acetylcholine receptor subunit beta-type acr-2-like [Octopus sinensis]|uniref:Acetylcholine receptor subunit beta-type acr-2-like n=1 Tax=Octopus sinensis TaxID=2607531 RepID=A0A6P7TA64_9MOLL|nr:acetylcholine receptor subunit beta-type acr-2-like [Octopus sinensis]